MDRVSCGFRGCAGPDDADAQEAVRVGEERLGEDAESFSDRKLRCHVLRHHKEENCKPALVDE